MAEKQSRDFNKKRKYPSGYNYGDFKGQKRVATKADFPGQFKSVATQVDRATEDIKALRQSKEKKITILSITPAMTSAVITQGICFLGQGTGVNTRDGNRVKSFSIRVAGHLNLLEDKQSGLARIMIVIDHDNQGVIPAITSLFLDAEDFTQGKPRNVLDSAANSFRRFTVLYDETFDLNSKSAAFTSGDVLHTNGYVKYVHDWYRRVNHYVSYLNSSATITGNGKGSMFCFSSALITSTITAEVDIIWRYTDI